MNKLFFVPVLLTASLAVSDPASALPVGAGAMADIDLARPDTPIQQVWHSGLPHRRVVGNRVYGGRCPPQGCPLWTQRDITPDPATGKYRYYGSHPSAGYGPGTYAAPGGGYRYGNARDPYARHRAYRSGRPYYDRY